MQIRRRSFGLHGLIIVALLGVVPTEQALGQGFSYQGQLKDGGRPLNAEVDFQVALWNAASRGTLLDQVEIARVDVVEGLFTLYLNFDARYFDGSARWLEFAVAVPSGRDFEPLAGRQPIMAAPYALFALAGNEGPPGPPGPAGTLELPFVESVATDTVAFGVTQTGLFSAGAFAIDNADNTQPALFASSNGSGPAFFSIAGAGPGVWVLAGPAGGIPGYFNVQGDTASQDALYAKHQGIGTAGHFWATKRSNTAPALIGETSGDGSAALFKTNSDVNNVNIAPTVKAENHAWAPAGKFTIHNAGTSANTVEASTVGSGSALKAWTTGTGHAAEIEIDNGSNSSQALRVSTNGTGPAGYFVTTGNEASANTLAAENFGDGNAVFGNTWGNGSAIYGYSSFGGNAVSGLAVDIGHAGYFQISNGESTQAAVEATTNGDGPAGNFTNTNVSAPSAALTAETTSNSPAVEGSHTNGNYGQLGLANFGVYGRHESADSWGYIGGQDYAVLGQATNGSYGYLGNSLRGAEGVTRHPEGAGVYGQNFAYDNYGELGNSSYGVMGISNRSGGAGGYFRAYGGGNALIANGRAEIRGTAEVEVLQIVGGADVAEPFEVSGQQTPEPGMVVSIDPDQPGKLRVADCAYDRTVAGVVSGAGGVSPGLTLQHKGTQADGSVPVALTGRVWVWCDADAGAIHPADMLTTSDRPGHAMKVTDHSRAYGATIGKAMTSLEQGRGLVLVLVSLQ